MCTPSVYLTSHIGTTSLCGLQSTKMRDVVLAIVWWLFSFWTWTKAVFFLRWFKAPVLEDPSFPDTTRPDGVVKISESVYLLSEPEGPPEMDIVFLHGFQLFDNRTAYWRTWMSDDKDNEKVCWPMTWLKEDFPKARILSLSINYAMDPSMLAEGLVQELVEFAEIGQHQQEHCPVVFVCHGLGGLVAKQIVIQAHLKFLDELEYVDFLDNIEGFFFYSTPHEGSRIADLATWGSNTRGFRSALDSMNDGAGRLNADFERIAHERYANKWKYSVVAETCRTNVLGFSALVVEEASARHGYKNFLTVRSDHFGVCKPICKTSTHYLALHDFIAHAMLDHRPMRPNRGASEKREKKLMAKHKVSQRHGLYDNREITIFRVGDRNYLERTIFDISVLDNNLSKTRSSILNILCEMEEHVKEVNIWHNQCEHLLAAYRNGVDKIVQALDVLIARKEGPITGLNLPLLEFICSKLKCAMLEGETLLLICSRSDSYTKACIGLSSPRLSKPTVSRFAFVLRELNWSVDCICHIQELYQDRDKSFDNWEWCEERHKLVYRGNLGLGGTKDESLEDDNLRQTQDQKAFRASLDSKPNNQLESLLKKRLEATSSVTEGCNNAGNESCDQGCNNAGNESCDQGCNNAGNESCNQLGNGVSKSHSVLSYFRIENQQFETIKAIGAGAYKTFGACEWLGETVAVAQSEVSNGVGLREQFETEVDLLARVQHPNVVELIGCACDDLKSTLVTELMDQDLRALITQQQRLNFEVFGTASPRPPFDLPVAVDIVLQIVEAMIHSHKCGVIHRDLKPENFLASPKIHRACSLGGHDIPVYYTIKLIDFGEAKMGGPDYTFRTYMRGTCVYRAPEVYRHEDSNDEKYYTLSADVYSFSMTCYEVFTGKRPFSESEWLPSEVKRFVLGGKRPLFPFPFPSILRNLIERCWAPESEDRPSFEDIRKELWQCKVYYAWPGLSPGRGDRNS